MRWRPIATSFTNAHSIPLIYMAVENIGGLPRSAGSHLLTSLLTVLVFLAGPA